jgi:hypothetical protein
MMQAKDLVKGRIPLANLPEPYFILNDSFVFDNLSKAINILAIKTNYRVAFFSITGTGGYVIMEKKKMKEEDDNNKD